MVCNFPVLMETLERCDESAPLLAFIESYKPLATIFCMYPVLNVIQVASEAFQKIAFDIGRMCGKIKELKDAITVMRNDDTFQKQMEKVRGLGQFYNIDVEPAVRRRRRPVRLEGEHSQPGLQLPGNRSGHVDDDISWTDIFKRDMWYVFMDEILSSLNSRFSDEAWS